jgi:hypothetical protein
MMEPIILTTNAKGQVWQQIKITIKIMWNPSEGQLHTLMFKNNNEFIDIKIIIFTKWINIKWIV